MNLFRWLLTATMSTLTACSDDLREATRQDADAVTKACDVRLAHFGPYYRFDGNELPDNAIWLEQMTQDAFNRAKDCIQTGLSKRNARAIIEHR